MHSHNRIIPKIHPRQRLYSVLRQRVGGIAILGVWRVVGHLELPDRALSILRPHRAVQGRVNAACLSREHRSLHHAQPRDACWSGGGSVEWEEVGGRASGACRMTGSPTSARVGTSGTFKYGSKFPDGQDVMWWPCGYTARAADLPGLLRITGPRSVLSRFSHSASRRHLQSSSK